MDRRLRHCPRSELTLQLARAPRSSTGLNGAILAATPSNFDHWRSGCWSRWLVPRLGHRQTIGAITHRLCRLIWIILHQGVSYEERGPAVSQKSKRRRTTRMIRELRSLGYEVQPLSV